MGALRLFLFLLLLPRGIADYYFCGSDKLARLNGWWLAKPQNPVFPLATSPVQRKRSHRCISIPGRCNVGVIELVPVKNGCARHVVIIERNRANPPEDGILGEMSGENWSFTAKWKCGENGCLRFFPTKVDKCSEVENLTTIGCTKPLPNFSQWSPRGGVIPMTCESKPVGIVVDLSANMIVTQPEDKSINTGAQFSTVGGTSIVFEEMSSGIDIDLETEEVYVTLPEAHAVALRKGTTLEIVIGGGRGSSSSQLDSPMSVYITHTGALLIADTGNSRVMLWEKGASAGIIVAGTGSKGAELHQLNGPEDAVMDRKGTVYIADTGNNRVVKWDQGVTQGVVIGGHVNGTAGDSMLLMNKPSSLQLLHHEDGIIYDPPFFVADTGNNRILTLTYPYEEAILVSSDILGSEQKTLNEPRGMFLDKLSSLFVVDSGNKRVVRFKQVQIDDLSTPNCDNSLCCRVSCQDKYVFRGGVFQCDAVGQWEESEPIKCIPLLCDAFPESATYSSKLEGWAEPDFMNLAPNYVESGKVGVPPICPSADDIPRGHFLCDKGEIQWPYPWCQGADLDTVMVIAVTALVEGNTTEIALENMGSPDEVVRFLAFYDGMASVALIPERQLGTLHPAFSWEHKLKMLPNVSQAEIDWEFTLPYPPSRKGRLLMTLPEVPSTPEIPAPLDANPFAGFGFALVLCLISGIIIRKFPGMVYKCCMRIIHCRCLRPLMKSATVIRLSTKIQNVKDSAISAFVSRYFGNGLKAWHILLGFFTAVGITTWLFIQCDVDRGNYMMCVEQFVETIEGYNGCQRERVEAFKEDCIANYTVTPFRKDYCFEKWPDNCIELVNYEECPFFMNPCGDSTVLLGIMVFILGIIYPTRLWDHYEKVKIRPAEPPIMVGGYTKTKKDQIARLLKYTIEIPIGVEAGSEVRFPLDIEDSTNENDILLMGKFCTVKVPETLKSGDSFQAFYDREDGTVDVLTNEQVYQNRREQKVIKALKKSSTTEDLLV